MSITIPTPPPIDPRQRRYSMSLVRKARAFSEAGWTPTQILRHLQKEDGFAGSRTTIRCWVDERFADSTREWNAASVARRQGRNRAARYSCTDLPEDVERVMLDLRVKHGLSYPAIRVVLALYHDCDLYDHQIRLRCTQRGAPKNPAKATAKPRVQVAA